MARPPRVRRMPSGHEQTGIEDGPRDHGPGRVVGRHCSATSNPREWAGLRNDAFILSPGRRHDKHGAPNSSPGNATVIGS
jgi:hypothetical protein